ncbi:MAG: molybdate transport system ATP-binding protein [Frankiaceae bacterium]|nr:molybdate transport system ATP-binding protein [Frankiaceae bacterium]
MTLTARVRVERGAFRLDVDVRAEAGHVVAVLGPNGSGKSTLLRAVAGLEALTSGAVTLAGRPLEDCAAGLRVPSYDRRIGLVFQDYRLFPHLSARDNVAFGPRSAGMARRVADARAAEWLDRLGLAGLAARKPRELSGGQAQRVALARALVTAPDALLLDEPLAALDVGTRAEVLGELRRSLAEFAGPVLLVTHDPLDAMTIADRLLIVEDGRVVQQGAPQEIVQRPVTRYVAQLVGLTLFRGTARAGVLALEDGSSLSTADTTLTGPALAVIRPSSVLVGAQAPGTSSARNVWQRRIEGLQALGDRVRITFDGAPAIVAEVTTAAVAEMRLAAGDTVWISVKATDITTYADTVSPATAPASLDAATA